MIKKLLVTTAFILSCYAIIAYTQPIANSVASSNPPPDNRIWNLRNADIRSVISEVSRITGKNFVIDPKVQGKVSIISSKPMNPRELYQVFLSTLQISGYAAIPTGHIIKIVPNTEAKTLGSSVSNRIIGGNGDEMVVSVVPVKYVPAIQLVPSLRPLMPQWSNISAYEPSNMVIISGPAASVKNVSSIIRQVDSSNSNGIDIVPLQHALAMDIVETIKSLLSRQNRGMQQSAPTVAADDRSNSILINGNKTERIKIRLLIKELDTKSPSGNTGNTQVVYLHFLRAQDLVPILAGIAQANFSGSVGTTVGSITTPALDNSTPTSPTATPPNNNGTPPGSTITSPNELPTAHVNGSINEAATPTTLTANNAEGNKPKVQIIAEPNTNSIILNAPPTLMRTLKAVIAQLDTRPAQVLIEALIAEIDEDSITKLGFEWGSIVAGENGNSVFAPGFAVINTETKISNFEMQLNALAREDKANILSTPSVVVLDNHQAKILIGKQVSVEDSTYPGSANGTTVANPYTTFSRLNVALHLYVRPQISQGNAIQLQIDQGNDTLNNPNDVSTTPVVNTSSIVTSVLVNSGDILVLGGLIQDRLNHSGTKIPIIGDIPGVGNFFQNHTRERTKKVLMVFMRPIILHTEQAGNYVSDNKYTKIRNHQLKWLQQQAYSADNNSLILNNRHAVRLPSPFTAPVHVPK